MHRRYPFTLLVLVALGSSTLHATQPNIVLIMADDMGFSDTSPFGGEINTPNLAQLASTGVRYTSFYNTARCSTTRASLLSGQYSHNVGMGALPSSNYNSQNGGTMPGYSGWFAGTDPQAPDVVPTLPEVMRTAGYDTSMSGKWHLTRTNTINGGPNGTWPQQRGFDQFYGTMEGAKDYFEPTWLVDTATPQTFENTSQLPADYFYTNAISERGAQFIRDEYSDGDTNPFFHYHAFYAPHFPLQAPANATDAQGNNLVAKYQALYSQGWDQLRDSRLANQIAAGLLPSGTTLSDKAASDGGIPDWNSISASTQQDLILRMAVYAAQVEILDQGVGKLIDAVRDPLGDGTGPGNDADNMMDDTMFVFLSDNGALGGDWNGQGDISNWDNASQALQVKYGTGWGNLSNTPFRKFKTDTYEGGVASPLIVSGYGVDQALEGTINTGDIGHVIDLAPTFFELGGATYPANADASELEGLSLVGTFDGSGADFTNRDIFFEHEGNRGVRSGNWKLVAPNGSSNYQLFDLSVDRDESNDLSAMHPDIQQQLRLKWEEWAIRNQVATPYQNNAGSPFLSNGEIAWLTQVPDPPDVIGNYSFDVDLASSDSHAGSVAGDFVLGPKILHSTISSTLRSEGGDPLNNTFALAAANGFTADFNITSDNGVDLRNMTFGARFNEMDAGESGTLVLRSSADGFVTDLLNITNGTTQGTTDIPVDLDLSAFQDVTDLTFRFYFIGNNSTANERTRIVGPVTIFRMLSACDLDGDGACTITDIDMLVAAVVAGSTDPLYDLDGDDRVTTDDVDEWRAQAGQENLGATYLVADANLDGVVDGQDFIAWNNNKFTNQAAWSSGDWNVDGVVDGQDFIAWNNNKFQSADNSSVVPEPQLAALAVLLAAVAFRARLG